MKKANPSLNKSTKKPSFSFKQTLHEMKQLVNTKSLFDRVKERKVKNMKMPMNMLKGIREKKIKDYKAGQERNRQV